MNIKLKVMDSESVNAISGALITLNFLSGDKLSYQTIRIKTDDNGIFNLRGESLSDQYTRFSMSISKEGYVEEVIDGASWGLCSFFKDVFLDKNQ